MHGSNGQEQRTFYGSRSLHHLRRSQEAEWRRLPSIGSWEQEMMAWLKESCVTGVQMGQALDGHIPSLRTIVATSAQLLWIAQWPGHKAFTTVHPHGELTDLNFQAIQHNVSSDKSPELPAYVHMAHDRHCNHCHRSVPEDIQSIGSLWPSCSF